MQIQSADGWGAIDLADMAARMRFTSLRSEPEPEASPGPLYRLGAVLRQAAAVGIVAGAIVSAAGVTPASAMSDADRMFMQEVLGVSFGGQDIAILDAARIGAGEHMDPAGIGLRLQTIALTSHFRRHVEASGVDLEALQANGLGFSDLTEAQQAAYIGASLLAASQKTGVAFEYLAATAGVESSLNAGAQAGTSSATGLFQFIEGTWLDMIDRYGPDIGLEAYTDHLVREGGALRVSSPEMRREILNLRYDPLVSAMMGAFYAQENGARLEAHGIEQPRAVDYYLTHFMGPCNGALMVKAAHDADYQTVLVTDIAAALEEKGDSSMTAAIAANTAMFHTPDGAPKTVAQFYEDIAEKLSRAHGHVVETLLADVSSVSVSQMPAESGDALDDVRQSIADTEALLLGPHPLPDSS
jgi:hypothetical protein